MLRQVTNWNNKDERGCLLFLVLLHLDFNWHANYNFFYDDDYYFIEWMKKNRTKDAKDLVVVDIHKRWCNKRRLLYIKYWIKKRSLMGDMKDFLSQHPIELIVKRWWQLQLVDFESQIIIFTRVYLLRDFCYILSLLLSIIIVGNEKIHNNRGKMTVRHFIALFDIAHLSR